MILGENWNDELSLHDSMSHLDSLSLWPPRVHIGPFWWLSDNSIRLRLGCVPPQTVMDPWLQLNQLLLVDLRACGPDLTVEIRSRSVRLKAISAQVGYVILSSSLALTVDDLF